MLRRLIVTTAVLAVASAAFGQAAPTIRVEQVPSANPDLFIIDISETVDTAAGALHHQPAARRGAAASIERHRRVRAALV